MKMLTKYLPDALINFGIWYLAYLLIRPAGMLPPLPGTDTTNEKMLAVIVITLGITFAFRQYFGYSKPAGN